MRIAFCDLCIKIEDNETNAKDILKQVRLTCGIYKKENVEYFNRLALKNVSFFNSNAYKVFSQTMTDLIEGNVNCFDINEIKQMDSLLNQVQNQLPSYTFSISKK